MQRYAIINTCGREDCCEREKDPFGGYYLASDVDARIAEMEEDNRRLREANRLLQARDDYVTGCLV